MFKPKESSQSEYEFVSIDELVPDNHLLRLIDNASEQALLTAACQNLKKIATHLARLEKVCCNSLG
ncbi:hypothetical protein V7152_16045 [Neobacillus drentensis]|uniref:hypothetical protein n=1 Tax=Neobacillus drentensis TaxID=220684 RepID=UPI002FFFD342